MHLCIVNLVIGTLYCSKGNIEFGVRLVMRALDPVTETLGTDTWLYAKRCLIGLIEKVITSANIQPVEDELLNELMIFLEAVAAVGKTITSAVLGPSTPEKSRTSSKLGVNDENQPDNFQNSISVKPREVQTVSQEASILRKIFIKINEQRSKGSKRRDNIDRLSASK